MPIEVQNPKYGDKSFFDHKKSLITTLPRRGNSQPHVYDKISEYTCRHIKGVCKWLWTSVLLTWWSVNEKHTDSLLE